jgi:DNA-binding beta-propeller fold protein YncE/fibronectin type 3 domain-containing protein
MKSGKALAIVLVLSFYVSVQAQPSVLGQWGATQPFPFISVHGALMPNGKVIIWDYSGNTRLWDPVTTAITTPAQPGRNIFCAGITLLADGKVFVPGGHIQNNVGLPSASYYDPFANTWTSVPNMNAGRWYPSATTLPNGDVLVTSGDDNLAVNDLPQVYQVANNTWRSLTSARLGLSLFPRVFLAPNGRAFFATSVSRYLDTSGSGAWTTVGNTIRRGRDNYGSACIDHQGRVYWFGGEDPPTATCERIDLTAATPSWAAIASMPQARRQNNVTILPDGKMLVTGGSASGGFNTEDGPKAALLYDPVGNSWATLATESDYRGYHSIAMLLPDGRVLSSGGDNHANGQVFSPPYLFNGARPTISSAPTAASYGDTFFLGTPEGASITKVTLTRLGSLTHAQNWNQRYLVLSFSQAAGGLNVTAPSSVNHCPAGHYLLWILNGSGVPSEGKFLRISDFAAPPPAPTGLTATPGIGKVTLNWTAAPTATGYNVKRTTTSGGPYSTIANNIAATSYVDTNVVGGTTYHYVVSALNQRGESPNSTQASAAPLVGGGGTGLKGDYYNNMDFTAFVLTRTDSTVNFDWGTGSPDPAIGVDTFSVRWTGQVQPVYSQTYTFYTTSDDGVRLWINGSLIIDNWTDHPPTENSGTITLSAGARYSVQMDFYENGGGAVARLSWSSPSQVKEIIPQSQLFPPAAPPAAPTGLSAIARNARVDLNWSASTGANSYNIKRSTTSGGAYSIIATGLTGTSHTDTTVVNGTTYYYVVSAVNAGGESPNSGQASATPQPPPAAPTNLTATPGNAQVSLTWHAATGATSYNVSRSTTSGGPYAGIAFNVASTNYTDNTVVNGTTYFYVVTAVNNSGESPHSNQASATPVAPNAPPVISVLTSSQNPAPVNTSLTFALTATDADGDTLTYSFDYGDGTPPTAYSTANSAAHTYTAPGRYTVVGSVTDGVNGPVMRSLVQIIHLPLTAGRPTASAQIIYDSSRNKIWNVNPDSDTVTRIDATGLTKDFEVTVGTEPRSLALRPENAEIWVASESSDQIHILDAASGAVLQTVSTPRGSRPMGVAFSPSGATAYVTYMDSGLLAKFDPASRAVLGTLDVGPSPRAIAISADSARIFVGRFISPANAFNPAAEVGEVREVSASSFTVVRTLTLAHDNTPDSEASGRGTPNYLIQISITPDGQRLWVPSKKDNVDRGQFRDGFALGHDSTVRSIFSVLDLVANAEDTSARRDVDDHELPHGVAFSPVGDLAFIAYQGNNEVKVFDAYNQAAVSTISLGSQLAPQDIVLNASGTRLFVLNFMSRTVSAFDVAGLVNGTNSSATPLAIINAVTTEKLSAQVLQGKKIFYNAADPRMSLESYISCAVCHLDGGHDGRVFDFTDRQEGFRNTTKLQGKRGTAQGNVHWTANFDEIQDFELDIRNEFGGTGFITGTPNPSLGVANAGRSADLDALAAFVASLSGVGRSPHRNADGTLTPESAAGRQLFRQLNCAACHAGPHFTDSRSGASNLRLHNVGTIKSSSGTRMGQTLTGLDTPTLKGIWNTGPYLHDGSAATLLDVITTQNARNLHGTTTNLTATEQAQLVAYLRQIDDDEPAVSTNITFTSVGAEDGYARESTETSNTGGTTNASLTSTSALRAGDDASDRQYKGFLSFDTASIPDGATILYARLRLKRGTVSGTNPFTTHGTCYVDIKGGTGFGGAVALATGDFQAAADATRVATLSNATANGNWSIGVLNSSGRSLINKTGKTQFRVYFALGDNDDAGTDYIGFYSGENGTAGNRPVLEITYQ